MICGIANQEALENGLAHHRCSERDGLAAPRPMGHSCAAGPGVRACACRVARSSS